MLYELIGFPGLAQGSHSTVGELSASPGLELASPGQLEGQGFAQLALPTQPVQETLSGRISLSQIKLS